MKRLDLSIGHMLGIGFGLLFLLLVVTVAYALSLQEASASAEQRLTEVILPRAELADQLERSLLFVGLQARGQMLAPSPERQRTLEGHMRHARQVLQLLADRPLTDEGRNLMAEAKPFIDAYLQTVTRIVGTSSLPTVSTARASLAARSGARTLSPDPNAQQLELGEAREAALMHLAQFLELQKRQRGMALDEVESARSGVRDGMLAATALVGLLFVAIGIGVTRSIQGPAVALVRVATALQAGNWAPAIALAEKTGNHNGQPGDDGNVIAPPPPRSEMTKLAQAFAAAAQALEFREARLRADAGVAAAMALSLSKREVAAAALDALIAHARAEVGALYWALGGVEGEDPAELEPIARHALDPVLARVRPGEGVPGQVAEHRRLIIVKDIPRDTPFTVRVGFDAAPPRSIVAVPILFRDTLLGVVVLASLRNFDAPTIAFLEAASVQIGIGFQNIRAHEDIERLVAELRDINERIQAQSEELQAQNEEIQAQNEEIQSQNEEIQAQSEELQAQNAELQSRAATLAEADESKNQFLAMLGHELRNPMAALTYGVHLIDRADANSERASRAKDAVKRQIGHLNRIIDDLLDITRISRGKITIERERVNLVDALAASIDDQRPLFAERGIALAVEVPSAPIWVQGDRTRLCQIVNNLLDNARKFAKSSVTLHLTYEGPAPEAVIRVRDDGIGIDASFLPAVFDAFRQEAQSGAQKGLGLGLSLVKTFTELHGGSVTAQSEGRGNGAEFTVRLPIADEPESRTPTVAAPSPPAPSPRRRILIVEDEFLIAWTLREALEMEGHEVAHAGRGLEAVERARVFRPDVVLCDIGLPDISGYEVARGIRQEAALQHVVLVALSGYAAPNDREQSLTAGFNEHLAKPATLADLNKVFAKLSPRSAT